MVPMKLTLRKVIEYKNEPSVLVLVGDQTPTREESQFFTTFLNQETAVFLGVEKISLKLNNPIVYFSINRIKRGYYECLVKSLIDNPEHTKDHEITEAHIKELLGRLLVHADRIRVLSENETVELSCVVYASTPPSLNFEKSVIQQVCQLGASLDIDLYITDGGNDQISHDR
jgi:hypothetical protein